jgi:hypothetical protein
MFKTSFIKKHLYAAGIKDGVFREKYEHGF